MNKGIIAAIVVAVIVVVGVPLGAKLAQQGKPSAAPATPVGGGSGIVATATDLVLAMSKGDFTAATARFSATMKGALGPDKLGQVWSDIVTQQGAFKSQLGAKTAKKQGFDVVYVNCEFARGKIAFQVAFDPSQQVGGLYVVPFVP